MLAFDFISDHEWIWIPILLVAIPYLMGPLLIFSTMRLESDPTIVPFNPDAQTLPTLVNEHFCHARDRLEQIGFEFVEAMLLPNLVTRAKAFLILMTNRATKDSVIAMTVYGDAGGSGWIHNSSVEFNTTFQDGLEIDTSNTTELSSFRTRPNHVKSCFPDMKPATLYRIHQAIARQHRNPAEKACHLETEYRDDPIAFVGAGIRREFAAGADDGYLRLCSANAKYRPTVKGALIMTWQELWPWKMIRRRKRAALARKTLVDLGLDETDDL